MPMNSFHLHAVKVVEVKLEHVLLKKYFILSIMFFVFVIQQYNLMVYVDFSLISSDPKVCHLLAGIAKSIADEGKGL
jgi:hypothetical protein